MFAWTTKRYEFGGVLACDVIISVALYGAGFNVGPNWTVKSWSAGRDVGLTTTFRETSGAVPRSPTITVNVEDSP